MKSSFLFLSITLLLSCKKEKDDDDATSPVIALTTPTNNQVFSAGRTVTISGTITDDKQLDQIHLEIINNNTGTFVTHEHYSPDAASYKLSKTFTAQAATSYKIKVEADDNGGNVAKTEVTVSAN